jgi:hypothetical protein
VTKKFAYATSVLACLVLLLLSTSFVENQKRSEKAYAQEFEERDLSNFGKVKVGTENNNKFEFEADFEVIIEEEPEQVIKNSDDGQEANGMKFKRGETITLEFTQPPVASSGGAVLCLVDKDESDNSIARSITGAGCQLGEELFDVRFFDGEENGQDCPNDQGDCEKFEVQIPDDIDRGKSKLVIQGLDRNDDTLSLFINKVKIK